MAIDATCRCATCKWWKRDDFGPYSPRYQSNGECRLPWDNRDTLIEIQVHGSDWEAHVKTHEDFGCVQHESVEGE